MLCPVCLEETKDLTFSEGCRHLQHTTCMQRWIQQGKNSCPVCRAMLKTRYNEGRQLYYLQPSTKIIKVRLSRYVGDGCIVVYEGKEHDATPSMLFAKYKDALQAKRTLRSY